MNLWFIWEQSIKKEQLLVNNPHPTHQKKALRMNPRAFGIYFLSALKNLAIYSKIAIVWKEMDD